MAFKLLNLLILFVIVLLFPILSCFVSSSSSSSSSSSPAAQLDPKQPKGISVDRTVTKTKVCKDDLHCVYRYYFRYASQGLKNDEGQVNGQGQGQVLNVQGQGQVLNGQGQGHGQWQSQRQGYGQWQIQRKQHQQQQAGGPVRHENYTYDIEHMAMPLEILKRKNRHIYNKHIPREFLDAHNFARAFFREKPYIWKRKLAKYAHKWAEKLSVSCTTVHSGGPYGENIFLGRGRGWRATDAVQDWANEHYDYNAKSNSCLSGKMCGHFTQIVWRSSHEIGCAREWCKTERSVVIVCNYDPPGNYIGENPFES